MTFFNSLKYRQWLYFFLVFLCEDSGFATAVKTAPVVGKPNGRGEHSQPHRCGIPGVGNDVGQVGLHHSGVSGVQADGLGLHQYIQLPLFQQQDFLTGMSCVCLMHWIYRLIVPEAVLSHIRSCTA